MIEKQDGIHKGISIIILTMQAILLVSFILIASIEGGVRKQEEEKQQRREIVERIENAESLEDICAGVETVFQDISVDNMAADGEKGFVYYEIPEEYRRTGGSFTKEIQRYTYRLCKQEGVRYALILAMIEQESGYKYDCTGDDGESLGYMQIMPRWHEDRMEKIEVADLFNPYQNIRLGVDIMKELIEKYGTIQEALAVYNFGETGAKEHLWSNGIYVYDYNKNIMNRMEAIEEVLSE